ncbi:MAG: sulfotransferase family protein [Acidobacteria bacterium]|nr:MAG: sulfotransferase family protein [Acidobacteriota bacterium]
MLLRKLWLRMRYGAPVIIVSGLPRSGTSMAMQMLSAGGMEVVTDHQREADSDNPKGYYELEQVKTLDKEGDKSWLGEHRNRVVKIISFLLRDLPLNLNYKVVFMTRDLHEVLASQAKMLQQRGETDGGPSDEKMRENYRDHLIRTKYFLKHTPNFSTLFLSHRELLQQPEQGARKLARFLGMEEKTGEMAKVVDSRLYRNRREAS